MIGLILTILLTTILALVVDAYKAEITAFLRSIFIKNDKNDSE